MNLSHSSRMPLAVAMLVVLAAPGVAATVTSTPGASSNSTTRTMTAPESVTKVAIPSRGDVLVVDWVDLKTYRVAIGGLTYPVMGTHPKIVLADGIEAVSIVALKAGMRVRIDAAQDAGGTMRLTAVHVQP